MALLPSPTLKGSAAVMVIPALSSSLTVTVRSSSKPSYSLALEASTTAWLMVALSATASSSWAASTVTVWGVSQVPEVKVSVFWTPLVSLSVSAMVTSELPETVRLMTTSALGSVLSLTV